MFAKKQPQNKCLVKIGKDTKKMIGTITVINFIIFLLTQPKNEVKGFI